MKKMFISCMLLTIILTLTACDEHSINLMSEEMEYQVETEYEPEAGLPLSERDPWWYEFLQEIDIDFMEQRASSIERIVVVTFPYLRADRAELRPQTRTFYITERSEIEYVYNILNETRAIYINEHPYHWQALLGDFDFFVYVEYVNGEVDKFQEYYRPHNVIGRFLETRGVNDPGYILGINERIWEFIDNLNND